MNILPASKISKTTGLTSWCMRNLLKQYVSKLHSSQCSTTKSQNIPHPKSLCPRNVHRTKIMSSTRNYACFGKLYLQGHTLLRGKSSQQPLFCYCARHFLNESKKDVHRKRTTLIYVCAVGVFMVGMSYAGVPLYRIFCQTTGLGGQAVRGHDAPNIETMPRVQDRTIRVRFNADVASSMRWNFHPQQVDVKVFPGETALAFYTAKNPTDKPIIGISTYNVLPFEAGQYFNKIQCFCFEEQRLNPHEQVDMPVFFYIDPEFAMDPKMEQVDTITLSYTFFEAKEGLKLPLPGYATS